MRSFVAFRLLLVLKISVIVAEIVDLNSFVDSVEGTKINSKPGRHVCTTQKTVSRPITVIQQYRKPVYTPKPRDCPNVITCPQFDVSYTLANRTVYQLQKSSTFNMNCCPGWTKGNKREKGCMQPICKNGCGDFGDCIKPEQCECRRGYTGPMCDTDIDECLTKEHGCQHQCQNTAGSYLCACQEGFNLAPDGRTCLFCFTCQKEYQDLLAKIAALSNNTNAPSVEMDYTWSLNSSLTVFESEIQAFNSTIHQLQKEVLQVREQNVKLTEQIKVLKEQQENTNFDITELQNLTRTTTPPPTTSTTTPPATTTTTTTPTTSSSTSTTTKPTTTTTTPTTTTSTTTTPLPTEPTTEAGLQFDTYDLIISLSNQIGLMEEKLELCQCTYGRGTGRGYG